MKTKAPGTSVSFLIAHLSLDDLDFLAGLAGQSRLSAKSPRYCGWLQSVAEAELERRKAQYTADPDGPEIPLLDVTGWSNDELANAMTVSGIACTQAVRESRPTAGGLLTGVDLHIRQWACLRMR